MANKPAKLGRVGKKCAASDWQEWVRTGADEKAVAQGCYFDLAAAERVRAFFENFLRHSKGQFANQPFELLEWQWLGIIAPHWADQIMLVKIPIRHRCRRDLASGFTADREMADLRMLGEIEMDHGHVLLEAVFTLYEAACRPSFGVLY